MGKRVRTGNYVRTATEERLCQRPKRKPGVAPDCEDAQATAPKSVSLPKVTILDKEDK